MLPPRNFWIVLCGEIECNLYEKHRSTYTTLLEIFSACSLSASHSEIEDVNKLKPVKAKCVNNRPAIH